MPQNSNFWLLRGHRFGQKIKFMIMASNHGGDPLGSILGPMGSHWGQKWVKTVKNYHAPKFEFLTTPRSSIWAKNRIYGYGAKSRWWPPRVHLGANGSHWGQKMGQNRKKLPCPKIRIFYFSARSSIWAKHRLYGYGAKSRWGPPWVRLGANGVPLGPKNGSNRWKITMPQKSNFWLLRGHRLWQNWIYGYSVKSRWGTPRVHLGAMGSHWGQKMGQNCKKLPCPKFEFLTTPPSSIWAKNRLHGYGTKSRWRPPRVHLGANGVPLGPKKWVKTVKNWAKNRIEDYDSKSRWGPPRVHIGANGVILGPKNGSKP